MRTLEKTLAIIIGIYFLVKGYTLALGALLILELLFTSKSKLKKDR